MAAKTKLTIRLSTEAIAVLDKLGPNRSKAAETLILPKKPQATPPVPAPGPHSQTADAPKTATLVALRNALNTKTGVSDTSKDRPTKVSDSGSETSDTLADPRTCPHPKASRTILTGGIPRCTACGLINPPR